jgi:hypothetical protein
LRWPGYIEYGGGERVVDLRNGCLTAASEHVVGVDIADFVAGRPVTEFAVATARFERCSFGGLELEEFSAGEDVTASEYVDCVFDGMRIDQMSGRARFERCSFRDVRLSNLRGNSISMIDCVFTGILDMAVFCGRALFGDAAENEFASNDFSGAELASVDFRFGLDLSRQVLPSGSGYLYVGDLRAALTFARDRITALPESDERAHLLQYLDIYDREVQHGQRQALLRAGQAPMPVLELFREAARAG